MRRRVIGTGARSNGAGARHFVGDAMNSEGLDPEKPGAYTSKFLTLVLQRRVI